MTEVATIVRPGHRRGSWSVEVLVDGEAAAVVEVGRTRRRARISVPGQAPTATPRPPQADPRAWPPSHAAEAARTRWADHRRTIATITSLTVHDAFARSTADLVDLVDAAGRELADRGIRRLDLRVGAGDHLAATLGDAGWVVGPLGRDLLCSRPVRYPWTSAPDVDPRILRLIAPLPNRLRRTARRAAGLHPRDLPSTAGTAVVEIAAAIRSRTAPRAPRQHPHAGAPPGSLPFGATRFRTIATMLDQVPALLRRSMFIDIGSGDGRVLLEARRAGFAAVRGRELDPELAATAARRLPPEASVEVGDALARDLPPDVGVVYLNNPFEAEHVWRLGTLIERTLAERPRPLMVLYANPRTLEPLVGAGLVLVEANPTFSVLVTPEPS